MPDLDVEICVLGGGPAGSVIARRLAQLGHKTLIVERNVRMQWQRAESLAPSILPIMDSLGLAGVVAASTFARERRALVRWESGSNRTKSYDPPSLLVERALFDHGLREAAASAGAMVLAPAGARTPQRGTSGGWRIPVETVQGHVSVAAEFLVDARGKRPGRAGNDSGPRTAAMSAAWSMPDPAYVETRIEAGSDEWFWGTPLRGGRYAAAIFVDATRAAGLQGGGRKELYRRLLTRSKLLRNLLRGEIATPIAVRDATSRIAGDLIGQDFIRTGEAAFSIDPLSSQGVQRAILSAIQAAAAVHTIRLGHDPLPAMSFFRDRQKSAAELASRNAARLYRDRGGADARPFWRARSADLEAPSSLRQVPPAVPATLPSFVRLSDALRIVDVPVLSGAVIRQAAALSHPGLDHPIAYVGGIALAPLAVDLAEGSATDRLVTRWAERMPAETARHILKLMCTLGILEAGVIPAGSPKRRARR